MPLGKPGLVKMGELAGLWMPMRRQSMKLERYKERLQNTTKALTHWSSKMVLMRIHVEQMAF